MRSREEVWREERLFYRGKSDKSELSTKGGASEEDKEGCGGAVYTLIVKGEKSLSEKGVGYLMKGS